MGPTVTDPGDAALTATVVADITKKTNNKIATAFFSMSDFSFPILLTSKFSFNFS
jgi:hypothetical protein